MTRGRRAGPAGQRPALPRSASPGPGAIRPAGGAPSGPRPAASPVPPRPAPVTPIAISTSDPLDGVERIFIDGSNLAFALSRGDSRARRGGAGGAGGPVPIGAVIGRLRAAFPASASVELVFDGRPSGNLTGRLATGMRVSYSGQVAADRIIEGGVAAQLAADGPAGTWGILVVTDDRELRDIVRAKGARVAGTAWLIGRIGRVDAARPAVVSRGSETRARSPDGGSSDPGSRSRKRGAAPMPLPRSGTSIGHRRPPRPPVEPDRDER